MLQKVICFIWYPICRIVFTFLFRRSTNKYQQQSETSSNESISNKGSEFKIPRVLNFFKPNNLLIKNKLDKSDFDFKNNTINTKNEDLIDFEDQPIIANDEIKYRVNYPIDSSGLSRNDYFKSLECKKTFNLKTRNDIILLD